MKLKILLTLFIAVFVISCSTNDSTKNMSKPEKMEDQLSYSYGMNMGRQIAQDTILDLNYDYFVAGIKHGMDSANYKSLLTQAEMDTVMRQFERKMQAEMKAKADAEEQAFKARGDKFKEEGPKFLAENKKKEGVKETASGLQYKVLREGDGAQPKSDDFVKVHLIATFIDGEEFDNTYERNPVNLPVENTGIAGLSEALKMMSVGAKWKVWLPASLGFGERGAGRTIPPHAILIYEIELLDILNEQEKQQQIQMMQGGRRMR